MLLRRFRATRFSTRAAFLQGVPRQLLSALGLGVPLLLLSQALTSCGSDEDASPCVAGQTIDCSGPGLCEGRQTCNDDGQSFGACLCEVGATGGGGTGPTPGSGGTSNDATGGTTMTGGGASVPGGVGTPCASDAQCPTAADGSAPMVCILSSSNTEFLGLGGPQDGYCSAPCRSSAECALLDPSSGCGLIDQTTGNGFCLGVCQPGNADGALKCGADRAQSCLASPTNPALGLCFPSCQSDLACGDGRFCDSSDPGLGLCTDTQRPGPGIGAPCTPETEATDCASSICLAFPNGAGSFCSASCTFAAINGCGYAEGSTGPREAACLQSRFQGGGAGDLGFCFELCDVNTDCEQGDWVCQPFATAEFQTFVGRQGQCLPAAVVGGPVDAGPG
jgi:hypothetical protein